MTKQLDKKKALKEMIRKLHAGADPEKMKAEFKDAIEGLTPEEIARLEDELVKEGMPPEEIQRLCSVHISVFQEALEKEKPIAPPGHPIHTLMEEHKMLLGFAGKLVAASQRVKKCKDLASAGEEIELVIDVAEHFKESEKHYLREENVLFPYIEKHGITQPPQIMWAEHTKIREKKKALYDLLDRRDKFAFNDLSGKLELLSNHIQEMLSDHFYKENNILFPTALDVISVDEWKEITKGFDEIGYCCFSPESATKHAKPLEEKSTTVKADIEFDSGWFTKEELEALLNSLPVDITFVDADDSVRYFSQSKDRLFVRTKAVIGRKVQNCHPQKSLHVVNKIVEEFKGGKRDVAEFWINMKGRLIYIRYFPVRKDGKYLGCIEVTQDITEIQKIRGEKKLL